MVSAPTVTFYNPFLGTVNEVVEFSDTAENRTVTGRNLFKVSKKHISGLIQISGENINAAIAHLTFDARL